MSFERIASLIISLGLLVAWWYLWFRLFKKAGQHWTYSLMMFVPLVNLVVLGWFIFYAWPNRPRPGDYGDYKQTGKML